MLTRMGKLVIAGGVIGLVLVIFGIIIDHVPGILMKKSVPIGKQNLTLSLPSFIISLFLSVANLPAFMHKFLHLSFH